MQGFDDAARAQAEEVTIFAAMPEDFAQFNFNASIADILSRFQDITAATRGSLLTISGIYLPHC